MATICPHCRLFPESPLGCEQPERCLAYAVARADPEWCILPGGISRVGRSCQTISIRLPLRKPDSMSVRVACFDHEKSPWTMMWPAEAVEGTPERVMVDDAAVTMPSAGRRLAVDITQACKWGTDISVRLTDNASYLSFVVYLAYPRAIEKVMRPPEFRGEAVCRVVRCMSPPPGSTDDDDIVVVSDRVVISLLDPFTAQRVRTPARFDQPGCDPMQVFDLEVYLELARRTGRWRDPFTGVDVNAHTLRVDTYMTLVLHALADMSDVESVEVDAQGRWRPCGSDGKFHDIHEIPAPASLRDQDWIESLMA